MREQVDMCNGCAECIGCGRKYMVTWQYSCDKCHEEKLEEDLSPAPDGSENEWCSDCIKEWEKEQREEELAAFNCDCMEDVLLASKKHEVEFKMYYYKGCDGCIDGLWFGDITVDKTEERHFYNEDYREVMKDMSDTLERIWKEDCRVSKG